VSNLDTITAFLRGKGLTPAQVAGVEGNLKVESNFSPTASNPREGAVGIAQWEGGRRTALQAYARAHGTTETDLSAQLGYLWQELQGPEHAALTALTGTTSAAQAATVFDQQFERSSAASLPARVAAANSLAGSADSAGGIWGGITTTAGQIAGAPAAAASAVLSGWQGGVLRIALLVAGAGTAAALVIVGAKETVKGSTA
jgi:Phage tail lysozyme